MRHLVLWTPFSMLPNVAMGLVNFALSFGGFLTLE